jgi:hypothetical protein
MNAAIYAQAAAIEAILSILVERVCFPQADKPEVLRRCRLDEIGNLTDGARNTVERIFSGADVLSSERWGV